MKRHTAGIALVSLLVSLLVAHRVALAQAARAAGTKVRATSALSAAPAAPAATSSTGLQPSNVQAQAAEKATLPGDLFSLDDNAIIIVGGKEVHAIEIRNEISDELLQRSGPAKLGAAANPKAQASLPAAGARERISKRPLPVIVTCEKDKLPPSIQRIEGPLTPRRKFVITGDCFGAASGTIEIAAPAPLGTLTIAPDSWSESRIVARMPVVRGAVDTSVPVALLRADGARAAPKPASFVARQVTVTLPASAFRPGPTLERTDTAQGFSSVFGASTAVGTAPVVYRSSIAVDVDSACSLSSIEWTARVGAVLSIDGWDSELGGVRRAVGLGTVSRTTTQVEWAPQCITETTNYVFTSTTTQTCRVGVDFRARAICPEGIDP